MDIRRFTGARLNDSIVLVALTLLVWGLYPFARGVRFAGDDVNFLFQAWHHLGDPLSQQVFAKYEQDGWTRALAFWPFMLAMHLPRPVVFLQLFYGCVWLLNGVAVAQLARVLWPQSRLGAVIAGCLMVTATSDYMTDSIVYGPHMLGVALFFFGTAQLLRSAESNGGLRHAIAAAVLLTCSFFTVEYTYASVPLLPVLVWLHTRPGWSPHFLRALGVLAVSFAPPAVILAQVLLGPSSYATQVMAIRLPFAQWFSVFASHVAHNFWPVGWAFRRIPPWHDNYGPAFSLAVFVAAAGLGALLAVWRFRARVRDESADEATPWDRVGWFMVLACAAIVVVNAASTNLGGEYFVRSHLVSRGWASLALALLLAGLARVPRFRLIVGLVFVTFVFLGVWGGVERESQLLGYGQSERRELASLLDAVPGIDTSAYLIAIQPRGSPSQIATNYQTGTFVYGDIRLYSHIVLAPNSVSEYSKIEGDKGGKIHIHVNSKRDTVVDPATCVIVFYSVSQGRFVRLDQIPAGLLRGSDIFFNTYQPARWRRAASGRTPRAVSDFLAHDAGMSFTVSARKMRQSAGLLSIDAVLADRVQADALTPEVLEPAGAEGGGYVVWLGASRAEGYSSLVWAREAVATTLSLRIAPGPAYSVADRLVVRVTRADGSEQVTSRPFDAHDGGYEVALNLLGGRNTVEVWLEGKVNPPPPPGADPRHLNGYLSQMRLHPAGSLATDPVAPVGAMKVSARKQGVIRVQSATYGEQCPLNPDEKGQRDVTKFVGSYCTGERASWCQYAVDHQVIGDPSKGCAKTFRVQYMCDEGRGPNNLVREELVQAEASGKIASLSCPPYGQNSQRGGSN